MRVCFPWLCIIDSLLFGRVISEEAVFMRIDELHAVIQLWFGEVSWR